VSPERDLVAVSDHPGLTDADWLEVNKLRSAYITGGNPSLGKALEDFCKRNAIAYIRVLNAILPNQIREALKEDTLLLTRLSRVNRHFAG
jgi:hypothetical protein